MGRHFHRFYNGFAIVIGVDCMLVVVDRLSKFAHFYSPASSFTVKSVAEAFTKEVVRLHGIAQTIVSDQRIPLKFLG